MESKLTKTIVLILVLNLAAAGLWRFVYGRVQKNQEIISELKTEIAASELKQKNIRELDRILQSVSPDLDKINDIFISEKEVVRFIENLEKISLLAGTDLTIKSASLPAKNGTKEPDFELNLAGGFSRNFQYLALLENMNFQIKLEKVRFVKNDKKTWDAEIGFKFLNYKF